MQLAAQVSDYRALFEMETERGLEARDSNHTEIKRLWQNVLYEIARNSVANQEMQFQRRQGVGDSSQINERITRLPEEIPSQQNMLIRGNRSEQAQQLLQITQGIDDVKALLVSSQSTSTGPLVKRRLRNSSLTSSYEFLNREVRKLSVPYLH